MSEELIGFASLSVGIRATISDDNSVIELCITFRLDIWIFEGIPDYLSSTRRRASALSSDIDFIKYQTSKLKSVYNSYESYLKEIQEKEKGVVVDSMEELKAKLIPIAEEQVKYVEKIEKIIYEKDERMKTTRMEKEGFLVLLSNCIQLIKDLTITFDFGEQAIRIPIKPSDYSLEVWNRWYDSYCDEEVINSLKKRTVLSDELETLECDCIKIRNDLVELSRNLAKYEKDLKTQKEILESKKSVIQEDKSEDDSETEHIRRMLDLKNKKLQELLVEDARVENEIMALSGFAKGKKKKLTEYRNTINQDILEIRESIKIYEHKLGAKPIDNSFSKGIIDLENKVLIIEKEKTATQSNIETQEKIMEMKKFQIERISKEYENLIKSLPSIN